MIKSFLSGIFGSLKNRIMVYVSIAVMAAVAGTVFYIKILTMERDAAVQGANISQQALEASQQARKAEITALEQARKNDADRYVFTEKTKKELYKFNDHRPLSTGQRYVVDRVRERYTNKYRD